MKLGKTQTKPIPPRTQKDRSELSRRCKDLAINEWIPLKLEKGDTDHRLRSWADYWSLRREKKLSIRRLADGSYAVLRIK